MRKLLLKIIPEHWISQRTIFNRKIIFISKEHLNLFFFRSYESKVFNNLKDKVIIDKSSKIVDIGANIGQAMLALNKNFPKNIIDSYEPQNKEFCFLQLNRIINKVPGNSYECAIISDDVNEVSMSIDVETGGRTSSITNSLVYSTFKVKAKKITDILNEDIGLIKIDIEGFESKLFDKPLEQLRNVYLIIEVRESTSEHIINYFLKTHEIFHIEQNRVIEKSEKINFCNLLISPIKPKISFKKIT